MHIIPYTYKDNGSRQKKKPGASSAGWWWLRSADGTYGFRDVGTGGAYGSGSASGSEGVALGFCTGADTINDSWDEIIQSVADGTYKTKYAIGDTKVIDLGDQGKICAQIAAFDMDDLADGSGKAPITWVCEELLATIRRMNPAVSGNSTDGYVEGTGTVGGWEKTEMRNYVNVTMKAALPENIRNAIKTVTKHSVGYDSSGTKAQYSTQDDVWIPSYREVFGGTSHETEGAVYSSLFTGSASRKKQRFGASSAGWWWLRSASSTDNFRNVSGYGPSGSSNASNSYGVALGFCM